MEMPSKLLENIAKELTLETSENRSCPNLFCFEEELNVTDIDIVILGLGQLNFPVEKSVIEKLLSLSSKAVFGVRDRTVLDTNIRNTNEILASNLRVTINEDSLRCMLDKVKNNLGLEGNNSIIPHLHNLLIYSKNNFFKSHKDTEKVKNMIATMVIVLPTPHVGGDLKIQHGKKSYVFSTENVDPINAKCVSFYPDCEHEVSNVKSGHRICLTYSLILQSKEFLTGELSVNENLKNAIANYFTAKAIKVRRMNDAYLDDKEQPKKLVYFFDHSYSEFGLRWNMLKGNDRVNALQIYSVANALDLIPYLALVDVQESWSVEETRSKTKNPTIIEFFEGYVTLSYWVDKDNEVVPFKKCTINNGEICWTKETKSFNIVKKEYEGYMGNWCGTMDHWYRRGAIVLLQKSDQIKMNFMLNFKNALEELYELTRDPRNKNKILEVIKAADKYLVPENCEVRFGIDSEKRCKDEKDDFVMLSTIAVYIEDESIARNILSHSKWKILDCDIAEFLVKLETLYGVVWCIDLLKIWNKNGGSFFSDENILNGIDSFAKDFMKFGGSEQILESILDTHSNAICSRIRGLYEWPKLLEQTFVACALIKNVETVNKVIKHVLSDSKHYPVIDLAELYVKLRTILPSDYLINIEHFKNQLVEIIERELSKRMRDEDDWSIPVRSLSCYRGCEHCKTVVRFLNSKTESTKMWPLKTKICNHVASEIRMMNLPVDVSVQSTSSPHRLVIVKNQKVLTNSVIKYDKFEFLSQQLKHKEPKQEHVIAAEKVLKLDSIKDESVETKIDK